MGVGKGRWMSKFYSSGESELEVEAWRYLGRKGPRRGDAIVEIILVADHR